MTSFPAHAGYFFPGVFQEPPAVSLLLSSLLPPVYHPLLLPTLLAFQGYKQIHQEATSAGLWSPAVSATYAVSQAGQFGLSRVCFLLCFEGRGPQELFGTELPFSGVAVGSQQETQPCPVDCSQGG